MSYGVGKDNTATVVKKFRQKKDVVFKAIGDGHLFANLGAWLGTLKVDFKTGGTFFLSWSPEHTCEGEFVEVVPFEKMIFTWKDGALGGSSKVTITLEEKGNFTFVTLFHEGLASFEEAVQVFTGWNDGLDGLPDELDGTTVRLQKNINASAEQIYTAFSNGKLFECGGANLEKGTFEFRDAGAYQLPLGEKVYVQGVFKSLTENRMMHFTWNKLSSDGPTGETNVRIYLTAISEHATRIDLMHDGFASNVAAKLHAEGWAHDFEIFARIASEVAFAVSPNVALNIRGSEKALRFYHEALGLEVLQPDTGAGTAFKFGNITLWVDNCSPEMDEHVGKVFFEFNVENLEAARAHLVAQGCVLGSETSGPDFKGQMIADPFGMRFHLFQSLR